MRDFVVVAIVLGVLPRVFMRPYVGILLWSWIGYMNPHKLAWGWARDLPLAEVAAIATCIGMLFSSERKQFPIRGITLLWLVMFAYFTLTTTLAIYPEFAWEQWSKVVKIQLVALLTLVLINDRTKVRQLVWVIALSLAFFGVKGGLYTLRTGGGGRVWGPPGGFIEGNNELALALLMILPLLFFLRRHDPRPWVRNSLLVVICLTVLSIIGSFSRGALLGLIACGLFLGLKSRRRVPVILAALVATVAMFFVMPQSWWDRMGTIHTYQEDNSAQGRLDAWTLAIKVADARPFGGGFNFWTADVYNAYGAKFIKPQYAHSIYFQVLGEHGWIGLVLFLSLFLGTWRMGSRIIRAAKTAPEFEWERDLASMVQVSLVAFAVGGAFLGMAYFDLPYHLVGIMVIMMTYMAKAVPNQVASDNLPTHGAAFSRR
jgi:probable O-glycosylation ligase, exosortase system type 1-associated